MNKTNRVDISINGGRTVVVTIESMLDFIAKLPDVDVFCRQHQTGNMPLDNSSLTDICQNFLLCYQPVKEMLDRIHVQNCNSTPDILVILATICYAAYSIDEVDLEATCDVDSTMFTIHRMKKNTEDMTDTEHDLTDEACGEIIDRYLTMINDTNPQSGHEIVTITDGRLNTCEAVENNDLKRAVERYIDEKLMSLVQHEIEFDYDEDDDVWYLMDYNAENEGAEQVFDDHTKQPIIAFYGASHPHGIDNDALYYVLSNLTEGSVVY